MTPDVRRSPIACRLAAVLLTTTCLTSLLVIGAGPALADGGRGGGVGGSGGAGGTDSVGGAGTVGGNSSGPSPDDGGGGGAGATGGNGGNGGALGGGGGGSAGASGGPGGVGLGGFGGGGGGGGAHGQVVSTAGAIATATGGNGGFGGSSSINGAGGGGAGGYGAGVTVSGAFTSSGTLTGGTGGAGGIGFGVLGGSGGTGGIGIAFGASGATLTNTGTITGGTGGASGGGFGTAGAGGVGVTGGGLTIITSGAINGGTAGGGGPQANAISFTGGTNMLELRSGSTISGNVVAVSGGSDTLRLGGSANATFDTSQIGAAAQYRNFAAFEKTGTSTWTLSNTTAATTPWTITAGTLAITSDTNLGAGGGTLTFNGGTLQLAGGFIGDLGRPITLNAAGGTIDTNGNATAITSVISGSGGLTKNGAGILTFQNANTYTGGTTINAGTLVLDSVGGSLAASGALTVNGGTFDMSQISTGQTVGALAGTGGQIALGANTLTTNSNSNTTLATQITGLGGSLVKQGSGILTLTSSTNNYTGGTTIQGGLINFASPLNLGSGLITMNGGGLQWATGNTTDISFQLAALGAGGGIFDTNGNNVRLSQTLSGTGALTKQGQGTLTLGGNNLYAGGTVVTGGMINFSSANSFGSGAITLNGGGLQWAAGNTADISSKLNPLGAGGGSFDTNGNNVTLASAITGSGGLTKQGTGALVLTGANTYSGGTTVSAGILQGNTQSLQGNITNNAAVVFNQTGTGSYGGVMSGSGSLTLQGNGLLNLTATNTYTGATAVNGGTLAVNGSITSNVTVGSAGTLGGNGTIFGSVTNNGILAPGNSIGTLTVNGFYTQAAGSTYQVEVNAQGQNDRINVSGAPGTATIQGGTVQVLAQPGNYGPSTTYTILNATGGRTGTYSSVTSNFAFLTPSLAYDPNNVFLTLAIQQSTGFAAGGITPNQKAVGFALNQSFANASGDFATVIGALAGLSVFQGPAALNALSGEQYADFGTMNVNNSAMFMNALGQQMAMARNAPGGGQRQALAQACEIAACDGVSPWSAWASALGGLGAVQGDVNASTASYNFGGGAAGIDYRLDPRFLVGIGAGYTAGNLWVNNFLGKGNTDSVAVAAYGSFTQGGFYADVLGGYAYFYNQLQRQILIPGLQPRTANGAAGANQALGQLETGYALGVFAPAAATVTPFARLQGSSVTQNAFSEWGTANSLSLNVAQQTTNSLRSTFGVNLAGAVPIGDTRTIDLGLRLGWQHEFASTTRSITAALSGAPFSAFTVYGATPQPDSSVVSFSARTNIAAATQLYLRYDGDIGSGTDNHTLNVGVRLSW